LDDLKPDAVAVAGWGTVDARAALAWCKRHGVRVIVMSETRAADGRRVWWREWLKSRIVRRFDAGLCGGESHRRYLMDLGIPGDRLALGYNVVDNEFFGGIRNAKWEMGNGSLLTVEGAEEGEGLTTEDTESTEDRFGQNQGSALTGQAGDSESDSLARELADSPVSESLTRSASFPASALRVDEDRRSKITDTGDGGSQRSEIGDPREGGGAADDGGLMADGGSQRSEDGDRRSEDAMALDCGERSQGTKQDPCSATDGEPLRGGSGTERSPSFQSGTMTLDSGLWALGVAPGTPYFLASNRFVERKNLGRLVEAYALYVERGAGDVWPLVLLGDGERRGELEALCGKLKLRKAEMGDFLTTEDTESIEEEAGLRLANQAGDSEPDSLPSKLADSPVSESPTRSAIGPASSPATSHALPATAAGGGVVVFAGFRQIGELPGFYSGAGVFVHPALEEPWGLVINEAMASGLPVISSRNVGAAEELVVEGVTGFLFDPGNVKELAGLMARVAGMPEEERRAMGRAGRDLVERKVPKRAFGEGLAKLLGEMRNGECGI
jgi:glycosyltransferase involved in cell wall biosynthesis